MRRLLAFIDEWAIKGYTLGLILLAIFVVLQLIGGIFHLLSLPLIIAIPFLVSLPVYQPFIRIGNLFLLIYPILFNVFTYEIFLVSNVAFILKATLFMALISLGVNRYLMKRVKVATATANVNASSIIKPRRNNKKISFNVQTFRSMLDESIVGQRYAKEEITKDILKCIRKQEAMKTSLPILGTFFFVGPTGVGKTELSKAIGDYFKQFGYQFLRFDMGNFSDYHYAATFTGSAKGYLGYGEGGALTKPLSENPRAVILFDEMEKTHASLYRVFMTLIDEGEIQDTSTGQRIRLDNAIIIFTSNLYQSTIGKVFEKEKDPLVSEQVVRAILTGDMRPALKYVSQEDIYRDRPIADSRVQADKFPPEFIGRIDKIIPFTNLSFEDYRQVAIMLAMKYKKRVDVDAITRKYLPIAQQFGVRQFIKKVEEEILLS